MMNFEGTEVLIRSGMPKRFKWKQSHKQAKCQMNYSLSLQAGFDFHQHKQYLWFSVLSCTKFPQTATFLLLQGHRQRAETGRWQLKRERAEVFQVPNWCVHEPQMLLSRSSFHSHACEGWSNHLLLVARKNWFQTDEFRKQKMPPSNT